MSDLQQKASSFFATTGSPSFQTETKVSACAMFKRFLFVGVEFLRGYGGLRKKLAKVDGTIRLQ